MNVCVPTGNFGNILAAYYAKRMGLPIRKLICASNANNVLTEFLSTGTYDRNRPFHTTISPSMDILISSNLERLLYLLSESDAEVRGYMASLREIGRYTVRPELFDKLRQQFDCGCCKDVETAQTIRAVYERSSYVLDPHTAVAWHVLEDYRKRTGDLTPTVLASTASPFKFCSSVLEALGETNLQAGTAILAQLSKRVGLSTPQPLLRLQEQTVRFTSVVSKEAMPQAVWEML